MLIGIDFDNTIAGYDHVFPLVAVAEGILKKGEAVSKFEVKELLRKQPGGEQIWMRLQGQVYGQFMAQAEMIAGVEQFLLKCRTASIPVCVVSHKTEFGHFDPAKINLHDAAIGWMITNGFFETDRFGLTQKSVYFRSTREEKVTCISELGCTHFIDDLEEVFAEPRFPNTTMKYLLSASSPGKRADGLKPYRTWAEISDDIFGD